MEHAALQTWDWQLGMIQLQTQLTLLQTTEWEQKGKIICDVPGNFYKKKALVFLVPYKFVLIEI